MVQFAENVCHIIITADCLSARLIILQSVFLVGGVWPQLPSSLGMQLKVCLVQKHPSRLGMQLKVLFTKSCVHLRKFIAPSTVVVLAVSLSQGQNGKLRARKKELGD